MLLTPRWTPLKPHPEQIRLMTSSKRFRLVPAGRRSGKTERAKRYLVKSALEEAIAGQWPDYRYFAAAPTRDQAKAIYWNDLKAMFPGWLLDGTPRESELCIRLKTGTEIWVLGMDKPQRIEGRPWNGGILDEYADMKPEVWGANVRPALADRRGWCWLIGVPEGRNHYYDLWQKYSDGSDPDWDGFTWKSIDIVDPAEIESARRDLDPLTFAQEFEASFINFEGRAYYPFEERVHCGSLRYDKRKPLVFTFDFNVSPGTAAIMQEQVLPNGMQGTGIIGEVYIPRNSTTQAVCRKLLADWHMHEGEVRCYGDATGGSQGTAKVDGSDWDLIRRELTPRFGERLRIIVPRSNPREKVRVNSVNTRLMNTAGDVRLMVDKKAAPNVVKDFDGVTLLKGGSGEIDKRANEALTHLTDGIGYYIVYEFPIKGNKGEVSSLW